MGFNSGFKGLKLFLRQFTCASVGDYKNFDNTNLGLPLKLFGHYTFASLGMPDNPWPHPV